MRVKGMFFFVLEVGLRFVCQNLNYFRVQPSMKIDLSEGHGSKSNLFAIFTNNYSFTSKHS